MGTQCLETLKHVIIHSPLTGPEFFWLLLAGQTFGSLTNVFEWSAPSLLACVWFPPSERASASALLGAIAPNVGSMHVTSAAFTLTLQFGIMVGLAVGPFWVQNPNTNYICNATIAVPRSSPAFLDWQGDIGFKMYYYLLGQAVFASIIAVLGYCKFNYYFFATNNYIATPEYILLLQLYLMLLLLLPVFQSTLRTTKRNYHSSSLCVFC